MVVVNYPQGYAATPGVAIQGSEQSMDSYISSFESEKIAQGYSKKSDGSLTKVEGNKTYTITINKQTGEATTTTTTQSEVQKSSQEQQDYAMLNKLIKQRDQAKTQEQYDYLGQGVDFYMNKLEGYPKGTFITNTNIDTTKISVVDTTNTDFNQQTAQLQSYLSSVTGKQGATFKDFRAIGGEIVPTYYESFGQKPIASGATLTAPQQQTVYSYKQYSQVPSEIKNAVTQTLYTIPRTINPQETRTTQQGNTILLDPTGYTKQASQESLISYQDKLATNIQENQNNFERIPSTILLEASVIPEVAIGTLYFFSPVSEEGNLQIPVISPTIKMIVNTPEIAEEYALNPEIGRARAGATLFFGTLVSPVVEAKVNPILKAGYAEFKASGYSGGRIPTYEDFARTSSSYRAATQGEQIGIEYTGGIPFYEKVYDVNVKKPYNPSQIEFVPEVTRIEFKPRTDVINPITDRVSGDFVSNFEKQSVKSGSVEVVPYSFGQQTLFGEKVGATELKQANQVIYSQELFGATPGSERIVTEAKVGATTPTKESVFILSDTGKPIYLRLEKNPLQEYQSTEVLKGEYSSLNNEPIIFKSINEGISSYKVGAIASEETFGTQRYLPTKQSEVFVAGEPYLFEKYSLLRDFKNVPEENIMTGLLEQKSYDLNVEVIKSERQGLLYQEPRSVNMRETKPFYASSEKRFTDFASVNLEINKERFPELFKETNPSSLEVKGVDRATELKLASESQAIIKENIASGMFDREAGSRPKDLVKLPKSQEDALFAESRKSLLDFGDVKGSRTNDLIIASSSEQAKLASESQAIIKENIASGMFDREAGSRPKELVKLSKEQESKLSAESKAIIEQNKLNPEFQREKGYRPKELVKNAKLGEFEILYYEKDISGVFKTEAEKQLIREKIGIEPKKVSRPIDKVKQPEFKDASEYKNYVLGGSTTEQIQEVKTSPLESINLRGVGEPFKSTLEEATPTYKNEGGFIKEQGTSKIVGTAPVKGSFEPSYEYTPRQETPFESAGLREGYASPNFKPDVKPINDLGYANVVKSNIDSSIKIGSDINSDIDSSIKSNFDNRFNTQFKSSFDLSQEQNLNQDLGSELSSGLDLNIGSISIQSPIQELKQEQQLKQEQVYEQQLKQRSNQVQIPKVTNNTSSDRKIIDEPKPSFKLAVNNKKKSSRAILQVRRRGKFENKGIYEDVGAATKRGVDIVKNTAAASFRVIEDNRAVKIDSLSNEFTKAKRDDTINVQKRSFRIGSPGEKQEITYKGIQMQRERKGFNSKKIKLL